MPALMGHLTLFAGHGIVARVKSPPLGSEGADTTGTGAADVNEIKQRQASAAIKVYFALSCGKIMFVGIYFWLKLEASLLQCYEM